MTTFVYTNPAVRYDVIVDAETSMQADTALTLKILEINKRDRLPWSGWSLKHAHNDEHSNPSTDQGVQWTNWDFRG